VADTITALAGVANPTTRASYTVTGCNVRTVPLSSLTLTYDTSAWTGPYSDSAGGRPTSANATGPAWSVLRSGTIPVIAFRKAGPETCISWLPGVAPPVPACARFVRDQLPVLAVDGPRRDQPGGGVRTGWLHRDGVTVRPGGGSRRGQLVQRRNRDHAGRHHRGHAHRGGYPPPHPDRLAPPDGAVDRGRMRGGWSRQRALGAGAGRARRRFSLDLPIHQFCALPQRGQGRTRPANRPASRAARAR
jgi:hypothetical protein